MKPAAKKDDYPPRAWLVGATQRDISEGMEPKAAYAKAIAEWRRQGELEKKRDAETGANP